MANEVSERKSSVTVLVDPKEIMGFPEIQQEQVGLLDLPQKDPLGVIQWLARRHLLRNSRDCEECHIPMTRVKRNGVDGFAWKCRLCDVRITIRRGSFFERSHLKLSRALVILHGWSQDLPQKNIAEIAGIDQTNSIVCWCKFCRDVCSRHFDLNENLIGGFNDDGSSKVVEIDESCFCKEKHSRGAVRPGRWVFGGIERGSGKCFLVDLANRTQETFSEIIVKNILPGTTIISKSLSEYNNIGMLGNGVYDHRVVQKKNFANFNDPDVHMQNIQNMWLRAKRKLKRQCGTSEKLFPSYLSEFEWRNKFQGRNTFSELLICIAEQFPV